MFTSLKRKSMEFFRDATDLFGNEVKKEEAVKEEGGKEVEEQEEEVDDDAPEVDVLRLRHSKVETWTPSCGKQRNCQIQM